MHLTAAGNVILPAYLTIVSKGFSFQKQAKGGMYVVTKGTDTYSADDPLALLGLIAIAETRGADWRADDQEIDDYLRRFES